MRAGPLSNDDVIRLLNARFVPVFVSNEDYEDDGPATPEERAERNRIWREANEAGLSSGTVHAYILAPDARVTDSLHVAEAAKVEQTKAMLQRAIDRFHPPAGEPVVKVAAQSAAPQKPDGGLVLHLAARYLERSEDALSPLADTGLGRTQNASWQAYPAENWIVLDADQSASLLPKRTVKAGESWMPDTKTLAEILVHFYPSTECNDANRNRIEEQELTATVVSAEGNLALARLDGRLRMKHNFYPGREDRNYVEARLLGYLEFDAAERQVRTLRLITDQASYAQQPFGVAVRSVEGGNR
jgi:hypothetical protein